MLHTFKLLLPALIPSWRFFDAIAPSPRIEFTLLKNAQSTESVWQEFRPKPAHLSIPTMFKRLFYNADWNQSLFLVSCAERHQTEHSRQEILQRIRADLVRNAIDTSAWPYLQFRLVFLHRQGEEMQKNITFTSAVFNTCGKEH